MVNDINGEATKYQMFLKKSAEKKQQQKKTLERNAPKNSARQKNVKQMNANILYQSQKKV